MLDLEEQDKICWVINLERKVIKLEFLDYKKYSSFTFVDPAKHLFGFTVLQPKSPTKVTNKLSLLEGSRFLTPTQNIEERTLKGSLDRYINLPSEHSKEKDTPIPIKKSLNLNENVPYRKISTSSAGSPHYHNQFGSKRQEIERR